MGVDWTKEVALRYPSRPIPVSATSYGARMEGVSQSVLLFCDDGNRYVVKGSAAGRGLVNDHIVGHLARFLGAPVPKIAQIEISLELIRNEAALAHFSPGVWHGSQFLDGVSSTRQSYSFVGLQENRVRFSLLAILYGWCVAQDHQFLYATAAPNLVYSVDHGHFFPGPAPNWTSATLLGIGNASPDPEISHQCALHQSELAIAINALRNVDPIVSIASSVAMPLDQWAISTVERSDMCEFLFKRYTELVA